MPAAKRSPSLVDHLHEQAPVQPVNNVLGIDRYYKSADLLCAQAHHYRAARNDEQLYVILLRLASLIIETIPKHKDYQKADHRYQTFQKMLREKYMDELAALKQSLTLREQPKLHSTARPADARQITYSNLPQMDWSFVVTPAGPPSNDPFAASSQFARATAPPLPSQPSADPFSGFSSAPSSSTALTTATTSYSTSYRPASQAAANKYAVFALPTTSTAYAPQAPAYATSRPFTSYPTFDATPSAPPASQMSSLSLTQGGPPGSESLLDALPVLPPPSAGPSLGPQEVEVNTIRPGDALAETCACPPPATPPGEAASAPPPPPPAVQGGVKEYTKRAELRDVHISVALMEEFLRYAQVSTRRGIESCGILAGRLSANDSTFTITTLIIPKQQGTTDTVQALNEEEIFEAQMSRELYPLGWIHTHPTQTCFLSSVDVHTQCGYQTMLDEAVAIVMAPTDRRNKCGIFRLSTPGGLQLVQKCGLRGFHTHPDTHTGQELYELCGHVFLNPRTKHEVIDLR